MIDRYSDAVGIHDDVVDFEELLKEMGLPPAAIAAFSTDPDSIERLRRALEGVAKSAANVQGSGGLQGLVGNRFYRLSDTVFKAVIAGGALLAAGVAGGPLGIVAAGIGAVYTASTLFEELSHHEVLVFGVIADAERQQRVDRVPEIGVTEVEIARRVADLGEQPLDLRGILITLENKRAVAPHFGGTATRYTIKR